MNQLNLIPCHAKLNLVLWIGKRSDDGYHQVLSLNVLLELHDELYLKVKRRKEPKFLIRVDGASIALQDNLLYRLYSHIMRTVPESLNNKSIEIYLLKRIPLQAGLGGGSSDLWSFYTGIKRYVKTDLMGKLAELSKDSLLFQYDISIARGKGELVSELPTELRDKLRRYLSRYWVLLVYPQVKISTADAYRWLDEYRSKGWLSERSIGEESLDKLLSYIRSSLDERRIPLENDFQEVIYKRFPSLRRLHSELNVFSSYVTLAGSGSTLVALLDSLEELQLARNYLMRKYRIKLAVTKFKL